jgi:hypothetical protein
MRACGFCGEHDGDVLMLPDCGVHRFKAKLPTPPSMDTGTRVSPAQRCWGRGLWNHHAGTLTLWAGNASSDSPLRAWACRTVT